MLRGSGEDDSTELFIVGTEQWSERQRKERAAWWNEVGWLGYSVVRVEQRKHKPETR